MTNAQRQEIQNAATYFEKTGDVLPCLLQGFDQEGEWIPHWEFETGLDLPMMRDVILNMNSIYKKDPQGGMHLLTSYVEGGAGTFSTNLLSIAGNLLTQGFTSVNAPKLKSVGGNATFIGATRISMDNLEEIGGEMFASLCFKLYLPKLRQVGDGLKLPLCEELETPKLQKLGANLNLPRLPTKCLNKIFKSLDKQCLEAIANQTTAQRTAKAHAEKEILRRELLKKSPLELESSPSSQEL